MEIIRQEIKNNKIYIFAQDNEGNLYHDLIFPATLSYDELVIEINKKIIEIKNKLKEKDEKLLNN